MSRWSVLGGELAGYSGCGPEFFSLYSYSERSNSTVRSGELYCRISIECYSLHYVNSKQTNLYNISSTDMVVKHPTLMHRV